MPADAEPVRRRGWLDGPVAGFTLVELVLVIVITGILAAVALPRFIGVTAFAASGYRDQVLAGLQWARSSAIAQRRWVKVSDQTGGLSFSVCGGTATDGCTVNLASCTGTLIDPGAGTAFNLTAPGGVRLSHNGAYGSSFYFDCSGRPAASATTSVGSSILYSIAGDSSAGDPILNLSVEPETGYVHP